MAKDDKTKDEINSYKRYILPSIAKLLTRGFTLKKLPIKYYEDEKK